MNRYLFIHVPKTAGTFLRMNFASRKEKIIYFPHKPYLWIKDHPTLIDRISKGINPVPLTICRNPYTWMESWYFYFNWGKFQMGFKSFEDFILNAEFAVDRTDDNPTWRRIPLQTFWVRGCDPVVLRQERLEQDIENIIGWKPMSREDTLKFRQSPENNTVFQGAVDKMTNVYDKPKWTREMRDRVNHYFDEDFKVYGYQKL